MDMAVLKRFYFQVWLLTMMQSRTVTEDICWSTFGDFQYKVLTDVGGTSFTNATSACERYNTTLTSVASYEEDKFLQTFAMSQLGVPVWIGLYRKHDNMSWTDGSEISYINKGYSRKRYVEGCVYMFQGWIEASCNNTELYFICKRAVLQANTCTTTTEPPVSGKPTTSFESDSYTARNEKQNRSSDKTTFTSVSPSFVNSDESTEALSSTGENTAEGVTIPEAVGDQTNTPAIEVGKNTSVTKVYVHSTSSTSRLSTKSISSAKNAVPTTRTTTLQPPAKTSSESGENDVISYKGVTSSWDFTFEKLLDEMTVKEKPVYKTKEAENSAAIGSVSILFLVGIVVGVVLLDVGTIRHHARMFRNNTKGLCNNCKKEQNRKRSDIFELKEIIHH